MSETAAVETAPEETGPASLREALVESFQENTGEETIESVVTDDSPTDDTPSLDTSNEPEADESSSEAQAQDDAEVVSAPEHWSDEDKAFFTEMPSAAQDYLLKREKQYEQGISSKTEAYKPIDDAFSQYDQSLQLRGIDRATAVRTWIAAQSALDQDPVNGFSQLIQTYGPEVRDKVIAAFGGTAAELDEDLDPEVKALREELNQLRQQGQQSQLQQQQTRNNEALLQVKTFKEETDADGKLLRPYFDEAQNIMRGLLQSGVAPDLQTAYEQAVWSLPKYRDEYTENQRKDAEQAESKRRQAAAEKAKKTAKTVKGKSSTAPPDKGKQTMGDTLRETWDESLRGI